MMATLASCWLRSSCRCRAIRARSSSWALIKRPPRSWFCSNDWRSACWVRLSASMTTASSISGVAVTRRNSCSAVAFSAGVWVRNGPCPCMVPQIAWNVMINIDALIPPRPKRSAAQMSRGIDVYKRAGERAGTRGRSIEYEDSQRHHRRPDDSRFQHASGGYGSRAIDEQIVRTQQKGRHQDDGRDRIRDSQIAPFDPIVGAETIGNRKGSTPKGRPKRNDHHCDEDEENRIMKRDGLEGGLDQKANPRGCPDVLDSVENLAVQCVHGRPVRLLSRQKMSARGRERIGPPMPSGNE